MSATETESARAQREWRCRGCGMLLGIERRGELHIKLKEDEQWITGRCRRACRRCKTVNQIEVGRATEAA